MGILRLLRAGALSVVVAGVVVAVGASTAHAKIFDKEHFHQSSVSDPYDCDGTPAVDSIEVDIHITAVVRGSSPFPVFREHFAGTVVTTNTDTGRTLTNVFALNTQDQKVVDNGDGTVTVTDNVAGSSRYYDDSGRFVLNDPGSERVAFELDYHGTLGNPDDDTQVPNSFRIVHGPTGNSHFPGFCAALRQFTSL
jgi:hypothetical protein